MLVPGAQQNNSIFLYKIDHHHKSSYHLSYKAIAILASIYPILYILSLWLIYFVTWSLYCLNSLTNFIHPLTSLPSSNQLFFLYIYESVSDLCWFKSYFLINFAHKWSHIIFVFLWLISLLIIYSRFILVVKNGKVQFSFMVE